MPEKYVEYEGDSYMVANKVAPKLQRSHLIDSVVKSNRKFGIRLKDNMLTILPAELFGPRYYAFYLDSWHVISSNYDEAIKALDQYKNCTKFSRSDDPEVHHVHPVWDTFKEQLKRYYQE